MYTGYKELSYSDEGMDKFYTDPVIIADQFIENEYLVIKDDSGEVVDRYCF